MNEKLQKSESKFKAPVIDTRRWADRRAQDLIEFIIFITYHAIECDVVTKDFATLINDQDFLREMSGVFMKEVRKQSDYPFKGRHPISEMESVMCIFKYVPLYMGWEFTEETKYFMRHTMRTYEVDL